MRVVFMGTPEFAAKSLAALLEDGGFDVVGVFTRADSPKSRGMKISQSPVKQLALSAGLPVFQPETLRDGTALELLRSLAPDLIAVVAYGRLLPDELLALPKYGCVNIHGSLLPKYRGAAPIQRAVLSGDELTGVTSMYLAHEMDSGDVIYSESTPIGEFETSGELFERLADMGARLLVRTLGDIEAGIAPRYPQDAEKASYAPPLTKELSPVDWTRSPREINKQVCALNPWPAATSTLGGEQFKIYSVAYSDEKTALPPGSVVTADPKRGLLVSCGKGETIFVKTLQTAGSKRMDAEQYLLGHTISCGDSA
jgi:methionyl-tRNA formyltransferase